MAHPKHSWEQVDERFDTKAVMDDWLGPTLALIQCGCGQYAVAHLVAWSGPQLSNRIFAIRQVDTDIAETWLANVQRDYCDLTRKQSETEVLLQAAYHTALLVLVQAPELTVCAVSEMRATPGFVEWRDVREDEYSSWHDKYFNGDEIKQPEPGLR